MVWASLAALVALKTACALAAGHGALRRDLTAALLATTIALPFLGGLAPLQVVLLSFLAIVGLMKTMQIASSGSDWPVGRRLWHMFGIVDTRCARQVPPTMDFRALGVVLLNCLLLFAAVLGLTRLGNLSELEYRVAWTACTATIGVAGFEVLSGILHIGYLAGGVDVPTVQRNPIVSRSLAEFWGQRWNRVVGGWLREFMFAPLARRRRPRLGLAAAFGASGAIHAWLLIGLGASAALQMGSYFLLQGAAFLVEPHLGLRRAPPIVGRLWTITVLLVPLPLLFGPWVYALDLEFRPR